ncbi:ABC transporter ATP-binding protein [Guptibacillus algicola]|uniref:ABC transporter ATP-binding protein n=1 Tax=Guptibacillus algicola TaxID=225844 RepID=UPI001CD76AEC|nr:ABC transporter ATP-binding protein [Alkalihalobacillus algicola]MCA0987365.1 ABC transporter ATP-binding protein [Alkalihalobacillus algicola]
MLKISELTIATTNETLVKDVTLSVASGEWVALVGESGSGKSLTALTIGGLLSGQVKVESGSITFGDRDLISMKRKELSRLLGKEISYVFQDYNSAFTPFLSVGKQIDEVLRTHTKWSRHERLGIALNALKDVKLQESVYRSYPCQLSGGQLQRVAIATSMMLSPSLLIADEPTTALDSITAHHVLELLSKLANEANCGVLFITHDLRHVKKYATRIAVMKDGQIVETGTKEKIFTNPQHPYTKSLLKAIPKLNDHRTRLIGLEKEVSW